MLTLNSADETDKSDKRTVSIVHDKALQNLVQVTDDDAIMVVLWKTHPLNTSIVEISCLFAVVIHTDMYSYTTVTFKQTVCIIFFISQTTQSSCFFHELFFL